MKHRHPLIPNRQEPGAPRKRLSMLIGAVAVVALGAAFTSPTSSLAMQRLMLLGPSDRVTISAPAQRVSQLGPRSMTIAASGDILLHTQLWRAAANNGRFLGTGAYDYRPMFASIQPLVARADLGICHMETPIAPVGEPYTTYPLFGIQPEIGAGIASAGYDRCSTASNHTLDRDVAGINRTIDVLRANGVDASGTAKVPEGILPRVFYVNGIAVSHLSYTYSYNGRRMPAGQEWRSALIDPGRIIADARTARALGAELVVVSMHWGTEGVHAPDDFQRTVAGQITAPGLIDLVIGHHAHVLQPIEKVNNTWVIWGTGNILSSMPTTRSWPAATQDGAIVEVGVRVQPNGDATVDRPKVYPTWVDRDHGYVVRPVQSSIASGRYSGEILAGLQASLQRTTAVLGPYIAPEPKSTTSGPRNDT